jgi:hypothetical protein|tara:strand:- start:171 stop:617 length:447 start_codon:yes stop_codon:yes gene_type:complete
MIIACPCGKKKFEVNSSLIPSEGKMLQCGTCSEKWFFKKEIKKEVIKEVKKPLVKIPKNIKKDIPDVTEDLISEAETTIPKVKKNKINKKINTLSFLVVVIISFVALVILADTFKNSLNLIIPGFDLILNSLYETIKDIALFIEDLFK